MKRISKNEIKKNYSNLNESYQCELIPVDGFATTKFIEIQNCDKNDKIIANGEKYGELTVFPYDENKKILSGSQLLKNFMQVYR